MTHDRAAALHEIVGSMVAFTRLLEARGSYPFKDRGLGRREVDVMFVLSRAGSGTVGQVARRMGVTSAAVSQVLVSLRRLGLVEIAPDPADLRTRVVTVSSGAEEEIQTFQRGYVNSLLPDFDTLSTRELEQLARLLAKMRLSET